MIKNTSRVKNITIFISINTQYMKLPLLLIAFCTSIIIAGCAQKNLETETPKEDTIINPGEESIMPEPMIETGNKQEPNEAESQLIP
jgi:hypothetical protein